MGDIQSSHGIKLFGGIKTYIGWVKFHIQAYA
jgi:hypothetical protein